MTQVDQERFDKIFHAMFIVQRKLSLANIRIRELERELDNR